MLLNESQEVLNVLRKKYFLVSFNKFDKLIGKQVGRYLFFIALRPNCWKTNSCYIGSKKFEKDGRRRSQ
jgi:hypothetical protein